MSSTDPLSYSCVPGTVLGDRDTDGRYPPASYGLAGETADTHLCTRKATVTL